MNGIIDNTDCYWSNMTEIGMHNETGEPVYSYTCRFNPDCDGAPCAVNELCCRYVGKDGLDNYIRMLLEAINE